MRLISISWKMLKKCRNRIEKTAIDRISQITTILTSNLQRRVLILTVTLAAQTKSLLVKGIRIFLAMRIRKIMMKRKSFIVDIWKDANTMSRMIVRSTNAIDILMFFYDQLVVVVR